MSDTFDMDDDYLDDIRGEVEDKTSIGRIRVLVKAGGWEGAGSGKKRAQRDGDL